jgi:hypothetical protein
VINGRIFRSVDKLNRWDKLTAVNGAKTTVSLEQIPQAAQRQLKRPLRKNRRKTTWIR